MKVSDPLPFDERLIIINRNEGGIATRGIADGGDDPRGLGRYRKGIVKLDGRTGNWVAG